MSIRSAGFNGAIYLNLADEAGTVIRADQNGWRIDPKPVVRFLATGNAAPLPLPIRGGAISDLRRHINCPDDEAFALLCGWLSACFLPNGPYPLLLLTGQQGSAKSTTGRVLKDLIDPERVRDRSLPKSIQDLAIWESNTRLLCVDNVSTMPDWLSDGLCRLATGGGFGTRTIYANDEETVFDAKRPVILNGIDDFVTRGDLLERSICVRHPPIPDHRRRLESELWCEFDKARPKLLGAILDRICAGLKSLPAVDKARLPRMADAAAFAVACEMGVGEKPLFVDAFRDNQSESQSLALDDSPIAGLVRDLVSRSGGSWEGTASALFDALRPNGDRLPPG